MKNKLYSKKRKRHSIAGIISTAVTVFLLLLITFLAYFMVMSRSKNSVTFGPYEYMRVLTGSMSPTISAGDVIIIKHVDAKTIKVGDIITYTASLTDNSRVTHRVVEIFPGELFVTKGDANEVNDENRVMGETVIGKVVLAIPFIGEVIEFLATPVGIGVVATFLIAYLLIEALVKESKKEKGKAQTEGLPDNEPTDEKPQDDSGANENSSDDNPPDKNE